ncbi:hypothetical protein C923_04237 [Plasmodium falciparum UGT5.1]|uniref:Uncharacterized protein n=1 Tax=Plasmodium falciparum UGT5.1 TaxID=1237627 RepID=W7JU91_PLAFA|nr:hypothetical protein C923_04237 [Plasmodium falciparum UGT5.1]
MYYDRSPFKITMSSDKVELDIVNNKSNKDNINIPHEISNSNSSSYNNEKKNLFNKDIDDKISSGDADKYSKMDDDKDVNDSIHEANDDNNKMNNYINEHNNNNNNNNNMEVCINEDIQNIPSNILENDTKTENDENMLNNNTIEHSEEKDSDNNDKPFINNKRALICSHDDTIIKNENTKKYKVEESQECDRNGFISKVEQDNIKTEKKIKQEFNNNIKYDNFELYCKNYDNIFEDLNNGTNLNTTNNNTHTLYNNYCYIY